MSVVSNIVVIQKNIRRYLVEINQYDIIRQKINTNITYKNKNTFLETSVNIIPKKFIYIYNNFVFDIRELIKLEKYNNPYTNLPFPNLIVTQINRICMKLITNNISLILETTPIIEDNSLNILLYCETFSSFLLSTKLLSILLSNNGFILILFFPHCFFIMINSSYLDILVFELK